MVSTCCREREALRGEPIISLPEAETQTHTHTHTHTHARIYASAGLLPQRETTMYVHMLP